MASTVLADPLSRTHPESGEDARLVQGLREGVESDYELLIHRFQQPVYNLALRLIADPADAGDVTQEVFLKVFRSIQHFREQSSLRTWIYRIAVNEAHNRRRWISRHKYNEVGLEETTFSDEPRERSLPDGLPSPYDRAFSSEKSELIQQALLRINPDFRAVVVLRDIEDLNYEEIAEVLQISLGTVKSRILRGREALRQQLAVSLRPAMAPAGSRT